MATLIGVFFAKLLSIAGIGGIVAGLFIRNWSLAVGAGVFLGVVDTLLLSSTRFTGVAPISWIMAIFVAVLMTTIGWWFRGRKRT